MNGRLPWACFMCVLLLVGMALPIATASIRDRLRPPAGVLASGHNTTNTFSCLKGWASTVSYHQQKSGYPPVHTFTVLHTRYGSGFLFSIPFPLTFVVFGEKDIWVPEGRYLGFIHSHRFYVFFCNFDFFPER